MSNFGHGGDWWDSLPLGKDKPLPKKSGGCWHPGMMIAGLIVLLAVLAVWAVL